tara:strand:- start:62 stop:178 length:117 start_codon:yes stop_codon:yes gene_type:complete
MKTFDQVRDARRDIRLIVAVIVNWTMPQTKPQELNNLP